MRFPATSALLTTSHPNLHRRWRRYEEAGTETVTEILVMKKPIYMAVLLFAVWSSEGSFGAAPRFVKVSDHCYYLQLKESGANVATVVTDDGILLVNPPQEPDLSIAIEALANITS